MKFIVFVFISIPFLTICQKNIFINFNPRFEFDEFYLNQSYSLNNSEQVKFNYFNYYISNIEITHDNGSITSFPNVVYFMDANNHSIYIGYLNINQIESIHFTVGVPKELNTQSGSLAQDISTYPENHALSFQSPSMYWGWQTGYMHMITGGYSDSNNDSVVNDFEGLFELHNVGDNNQQKVTLNNIVQSNTSNDFVDININCYINRWIGNISLSTLGVLHGEFGINQQVMEQVIPNQVFEQDEFSQIHPENGGFRIKVSDEEVEVLSDSGVKIDAIALFNCLGSAVLLNKNKTTLSVSKINAGVYFLSVKYGHDRWTKKIYIP